MFRIMLFCFFLLLINVCFGINDFSWNSTTDLTTQSGTNFAPFGKIVSNDTDSAIAIWRIYRNGSWTIESAYSQNNGKTWYDPQEEIFSISQNIIVPALDIAINDDDIAIAAYTSYNASSPSFKYSLEEAYSNDAGNTWSTLNPPLEVSDYEILSPTLAIQGDGLGIVVWVETTDGLNYHLNGKYFDGAVWNYSNFIVSDGINPKISMNINQQAVVIWEDDGTIFTKHSVDAGENWSLPTHSFFANGTTPQITMNNDGNTVAVWNDSGIIKSSYSWDGGNTWSDPQVLSSSGASVPKISSNSDGEIIVAWQRNNGIESCFSSNGGLSFSIPIIIYADGIMPEVSLNDDGIASISFIDSHEEVLVSTTTNSGANFSFPVAISSSHGSAQNISLSVNNQDNALVLWSLEDTFEGSYKIQTLNGNMFHVNSEKLKKKLYLQTDLVNKITWDAMPDASIYRVYLDDELTNLIFEGNQTSFWDHGQKKGERKNYFVTWADFWGEESSAVEIAITY